MARLLSRLAVNATLATLQAYLPAELVGIVLESADSLVLPAVESWYAFRRPQPSPDHVEVEVYEIPGSMRLPSWNLNLSQWLAGGRGPLDSSWGLNVGLNYQNRESAKASEMADRGRKYVAGILRSLANHPELGQAGGKTTITDFSSPRLYPVTADITRGPWRVEVPFIVRLQETHAGELTGGGGVAPSAILEQV